MTRATDYVNHMYASHKGRAAVTVGVDGEQNSIHPFVFENARHVPIGLIGMAANHVSVPTEVDIYHISAFDTGNGQGSEIMASLCTAADEFGVCLCIEATAQDSGKQTMSGTALATWYRSYGFEGDGMMVRNPE